MSKREPITSGELLIAWRKKHGLTTREAAAIFHRTRRSIQQLEKGQHKRGFPEVIDDLARLYEKEKPRKRAKVAAAA